MINVILFEEIIARLVNARALLPQAGKRTGQLIEPIAQHQTNAATGLAGGSGWRFKESN
jgi:hypothetical protein